MSEIKEINIIKQCFHRVRDGQTMEEIAKTYGLNKATIQFENGVESIDAGDLLLIPTDKKNIYIVQPMDTHKTISKKLNISVEQLSEKYKHLFIGQRIIY